MKLKSIFFIFTKQNTVLKMLHFILCIDIFSNATLLNVLINMCECILLQHQVQSTLQIVLFFSNALEPLQLHLDGFGRRPRKRKFLKKIREENG